MKSNILSGYQRHDVVKLLKPASGLSGVELGVAQGIFSKRMVESRKFDHFFGVDMYADQHDINQYKSALKNIGLFESYKLLRMTFDEALDLFSDSSLDFVYVDGYAHTGEEGGDTIYKWFKKVKIGGVLAGDDYHENWPLVMNAVNAFVEDLDTELYITELTEELDYCNYPSWAIIKSQESLVSPCKETVEFAKMNERLRRQQWIRKMFVNEYLIPRMPSFVVSLAKAPSRVYKKFRKK